jgi:serine protease Do
MIRVRARMASQPALRRVAPWLLLAATAQTGLAEGGAPLAGAEPLATVKSLEQAFRTVAEQVRPSVVGLRVQRRYFSARPGGDDSSSAPLLDQVVTVNGTGTVVREDGLILTNEHVVQSALRIDVLLHDGRTLAGAIVAADPRCDLAILRVARGDLHPATMCRWEDVARGQWTIAVGNPFGLGQDGKLSIAVGVISNLGRRLPGLGEMDDRLYSDMVQITTPIHPGNSGGPLFNVRGEWVGVVTAMHTRSAADEGVGFAIPLSAARRRQITCLMDGRSIEYGYLGLTVRDLPPVESPPDQREAGVIVQNLDSDGPAARAGLRVGDRLVRLNERPVRSAAELLEQVGECPIGSRVVLVVQRDVASMALEVDVMRRDVTRVGWMRGGAILWRGLRLADVTREVRDRFQVESAARGVVVIEAARERSEPGPGVSVGDVIEGVGDRAVRDTYDFGDLVRNQDGPVLLRVRRKGHIVIPP